jgi:hypothetical protein
MICATVVHSYQLAMEASFDLGLGAASRFARPHPCGMIRLPSDRSPGQQLNARPAILVVRADEKLPFARTSGELHPQILGPESPSAETLLPRGCGINCAKCRATRRPEKIQSAYDSPLT